jgi:solute carrier family 35 protein E1
MQIQNARAIFLHLIVLSIVISIVSSKIAPSALPEPRNRLSKVAFCDLGKGCSKRPIQHNQGKSYTISSNSLDHMPKSKVVAATQTDLRTSTRKRIETVVFLGLWYVLSAYYNIYNKRALNLLSLPCLVAVMQLAAGFVIFLPLWALGLREKPASNWTQFVKLCGQMRSVSIYSALTHMSGVIALGAGAVSFTQVVKASEPAFTSAISAIFFREFLPWQAYAALVPVMAGVAIASATELSFSMYCLGAGIFANTFAAARGVFGKRQMGGELKKLSAENYYAMLTILSCILLIPVVVLVEGKEALKLFSHQEALQNTLISGILFYLYNEVSFKALKNLDTSVSHALANTLKRVVIVVSSVVMFKDPITSRGMLGASMAIGGVLLYSLACIFFRDSAQGSAVSSSKTKSS